MYQQKFPHNTVQVSDWVTFQTCPLILVHTHLAHLAHLGTRPPGYTPTWVHAHLGFASEWDFRTLFSNLFLCY